MDYIFVNTIIAIVVTFLAMICVLVGVTWTSTTALISFSCSATVAMFASGIVVYLLRQKLQLMKDMMREIVKDVALARTDPNSVASWRGANLIYIDEI